jgi:hypothetical protein
MRPRYRDQYMQHRRDAKARGIGFLLSFEDWLAIWVASGKLDLRGTKKGQYCMARYGDVGPYALGNVRVILHSQNVKEICRGSLTLEHRAKIGAANATKVRSQQFRDNLAKLAIIRCRNEHGQFT